MYIYMYISLFLSIIYNINLKHLKSFGKQSLRFASLNHRRQGSTTRSRASGLLRSTRRASRSTCGNATITQSYRLTSKKYII